MKRREFIAGAAVLAAASGVKAAPGDKPAAAHHDEAYGSLATAAGDCVRRAQACLQHCLVMLGGGDTSLAGCATAVRDTIATGQALETLAAAGSKHAKAMSRVALDVAKACEAECKKHAQHPPCKACGEACSALIAEINKLPA
jgi:Cys-rich four helix bundle protein (predicted Tat secretion target)